MANIIADIAFAGATKGLDRKDLAFFHLGLVAALDNGDAFTAVNAVLNNVVTIQVLDRLDRIGLSGQLHFVALHGFLNGSANIAHSDIDAGFPNPSVRSVFGGSQKIVIEWVEGHGKRTVDNASVDVGAKVDLHHVVLLQDHLVTCVRGVVGSAVVDAQACGEPHAAFDVVSFFKAGMARQRPYAVLDPLGDFRQSLTRFDVSLCPLPHLPVDFGTLTILLQEIIVHPVEMALLLTGGPEMVVVGVIAQLTLGVLAIGEKGGDGDSGRGCLGFASTLFLLRFSLLLFFGCCRPHEHQPGMLEH